MKKFISKAGVRVVNEEGEMYAIVMKHLGNGQLLVKLKDDLTDRVCKIRGKFNKKNKDTISVGTWVLVGEQGYSTKKTHCELLEVYTPSEMKKLKDMRNDWPSEFTGEEKSEFTDFIPVEESDVSMDINFDDI